MNTNLDRQIETDILIDRYIDRDRQTHFVSAVYAYIELFFFASLSVYNWLT